MVKRAKGEVVECQYDQGLRAKDKSRSTSSWGKGISNLMVDGVEIIGDKGKEGLNVSKNSAKDLSVDCGSSTMGARNELDWLKGVVDLVDGPCDKMITTLSASRIRGM
ncbi:hypothetical protein CFOL_v3_27049 [Cephalotus follicularis]|uniref:Uncharacterized protein n=1 Tax=Cephalotus follicularis TaxID=3775 RepID=A0A1Q3CTQ0_CEPFO|nr:hypothetical protein CFOL_v3_27046 [Cephalotus follicularis]GAV83603.1 hypothetical protein CFOL_v3_27049 [Cephalotus follicularis]